LRWQARHEETPDAGTGAATTTGPYAPLGSAKIDRRMLCRVQRQTGRSVKKGFSAAVGLARLTGKVTPHTPRHTAATWLMQRGVPVREAAGFLGASAEMLLGTYGHHHPDFLHGAAHAITFKHRVSVVETVVGLEDARERRLKAQLITWSEWQDSNLRPLRPERFTLPENP
jgi:hypothetical protein